MTLPNIHPVLERLEHVGDLMPVEIALPNGRVFPRARLLVYRTHVFVLWHSPQMLHPTLEAVLYLTEDPVLPPSHLPRRHQRMTLKTSDGEARVTGMLGCRCGSELRLLSPIDAVTMATDAGYAL